MELSDLGILLDFHKLINTREHRKAFYFQRLPWIYTHRAFVMSVLFVIPVFLVIAENSNFNGLFIFIYCVQFSVDLLWSPCALYSVKTGQEKNYDGR